MCGNSTPVGTGGAGVCGVMLRRPFLRSLECRQLATKSGSGENGLPPRVQLQRVSHPWRAPGTWERLRGTHDRDWLQVWAFHRRQRDILSRARFWFVALLLPASGFVPSFPQVLARRRPRCRPFVWRPPRSPLLSRVPPREGWLSTDCREGRRKG